MSKLILPAVKEKSQVKADLLIPFIFGSREIYERVKKAIEVVKENFPIEEIIKFTELSRTEQVIWAYKFRAILIKHGLTDFFKDDNLPPQIHEFLPIEAPGGVSDVMVKPILRVLGTEKQIAQWMPLFDSYRVIGAYAQTELAHGSDVQSLETTATLDIATREWVIHTPSINAYKWWPGELANLANTVVVYCRTIIENKNVGVLPFIMYIRDAQTHQLLPGVETGDIGPKLGYFPKENGFLAFTQFRVPFDALLGKFFHVDEKNRFMVVGNEKIVYSAMMKVRITLLSTSAMVLGKAVCIATRYSFLRKQFRDSRGQEVPVIDYQLQQNKLFPLLAKSYIMAANYQTIKQMIERNNQNIAQRKDFSLLQECHVLLAGAKSFYTHWTLNGLYTCMQACGGHGYSQYSGIPYLIQTFSPNTILEGENTVLALQVSRFLLKNYGNFVSGNLEKIKGQAAFIKEGPQLDHCKITSKDKLKCRTCLFSLFQRLTLQLLEEVAAKFAEKMNQMDRLTIQNKVVGIKLFEMSKIYTIAFSLLNAFQYSENVTDSATRDALENLFFLFAFEMIIENASLLVTHDCITPDILSWARELYEEGLVRAKPDALVLADAFVPDSFGLYSALASDNERPYENLYRWAKKSAALNHVDLITPYLETIRKASLEVYPKL